MTRKDILTSENPFLELSGCNTAITIIFEIILFKRSRWNHCWTKSVCQRAQHNLIENIVTNNPFVVFIHQFDITVKFDITRTLSMLSNDLENDWKLQIISKNLNLFFWGWPTDLIDGIIFGTMIKSAVSPKLFGMEIVLIKIDLYFLCTTIGWTSIFIAVTYLIIWLTVKGFLFVFSIDQWN